MKNPHETALNRIMENPRLIGLDSVVLISKETRLFNTEGRLVSEPDILIYDLNKGWVIGEYNSSSKHPGKVYTQLNRDIGHLISYGVISEAELLYIRGDMQVHHHGQKNK